MKLHFWKLDVQDGSVTKRLAKKDTCPWTSSKRFEIWPTSHIWTRTLIWMIWAYSFGPTLLPTWCNRTMYLAFEKRQCCFITELRAGSQGCPARVKDVSSHTKKQEVWFKSLLCRNFKRKRKGFFSHVEPRMPFSAQLPCFMECQVNLPI